MISDRRFDLTVVGGGVSGLTTALVLQRSGRRVLVVTADPLDRTTSSLAAAVWFPTRVGPRERALGWGRRTFEVLASIARSDPGAGVVMRRTLMLYRDPPGTPWWTGAVGEVTRARADELPPGYGHGLWLDAPLAEMPLYLRWLADRFAAVGGEVRKQRLSALAEAGELAPVIVNCSGLAARTLAGDDTVVPLRGQIVRTTNPGLTVSLRDQAHPEGYTYVHPRSADCVLGGTIETGEWDTTPDPQVGEAILRRCRQLAPALEEAQVLGHAVGLRPGRPTVRLALDPAAPDGTTIVHNYGHGGAGVTLSWGCAEEVAALLDRVP